MGFEVNWKRLWRRAEVRRNVRKCQSRNLNVILALLNVIWKSREYVTHECTRQHL